MRNFDKTTILLFVVALMLTAISIYLYMNKILEPTFHNNEIIAEYEKNKKIEEENEVEEEEEVKQQTEEERLLELKSMSEADRIYEYFSEYMRCIDLEDYEKAYSYLYPEFKQNYFPEQTQFEEYAKKAYPQYLGIQYEDIDRQGTYYILTVYIYDALADVIETYVEQKFVIYENTFGEFVLSFQVSE